MHIYVAAVCPAADGSELESVAPAGMVNVVARLEAFAGMSRMKRLALVVLCHTVTDKHMMRLKVLLKWMSTPHGSYHSIIV
jgi:hypothetical protein